MELSGVIFVVLAVAWAVYLIPMTLRHHDEVARTRSIDRFSTAIRVLARREPASKGGARLVVTAATAATRPAASGSVRSRIEPAPGTSPVAAADSAAATVSSAPPAVRRTPAPVARAAARAAARRRRRVLGFLVLADLVVAALAWFLVVPWWAVSIPAALTLLYVVLCRTQVRRERDVSWDRELVAAADAEPEVDAGAAEFDELDPFEDTMSIPVPVLDAVAVATEDGGSLWDPLPVTLPTYVGKPQVRRTVSTIDLSAPDTWTSGRSEEDSQLVAETAAAQAAETADTAAVDQQRAVGS